MPLSCSFVASRYNHTSTYQKTHFDGGLFDTYKALKPCFLVCSQELFGSVFSHELPMIIYRGRRVLQALGETFLRSRILFPHLYQ